MKLTKLTTVLTLSIMTLGISACSNVKHDKPVPVENAYVQPDDAQNDTSAVQTAGIGNNDEFQGENVDTGWMNDTTKNVAQQIGVKNNTIYFGFDKSGVTDDYDQIIEANANYLKSHPSAKVRLEGNTDPRGSREYNIGLGQRRSDGVEQRLLALGVNKQQLTTVSYGQEKPAAPGDTPLAYSLDRRVNIVYTVG